ncbi:MAG: F-box-like domain-containing protein [Gammaproteobacteria bacterium]|jgi:alpha-tubulin suppressor-like RCC1 family protein
MSYKKKLDKLQKKQQSRKEVRIKKLPLELLIEIVLYLKAPSTDIANFALVCKWFNTAFEYKYVWKTFSEHAFSKQFVKKHEKFLEKNKTKKLSWKNFFKENYIHYMSSKKIVSCGNECTIFLVKSKNGEIKAYSCGKNNYGQLGLGHKKNVTKPQEIKRFPKNSKILHVSCGYSHTVFLVQPKNGKIKVYGCGQNKGSLLGLVHKKDITTPQEIKRFPKGSKILHVSCGGFYTVFLVQPKNGERKVYGCGQNGYGQLGLDCKKNVTKPQEIKVFPENSKILNVSCGGCHTVFLVQPKSGKIKIYSCGKNNYGQLGLGHMNKVTKPQEIKRFPKNSKILNVSCGGWHTVFLVKLKSGEIKAYSCGRNTCGQLGLNHNNNATKPQEIKGFPENSKILNVSCGVLHTIFLVLLKSGKIKVFSCGRNTCGQLGLDHNNNATKPQEIKGFPENSKILNVSCGGFYTVFLVQLKSDEIKRYSCVQNDRVQLGLGHNNDVTKPQKIKKTKRCCIQ